MFEGFKAPGKVYGCSFCKLNYINKGMRDSFGDHKTLGKLIPSYLEVKLQQVGYGYNLNSLKYHKTGTNEVFEERQAIKKVPMFF